MRPLLIATLAVAFLGAGSYLISRSAPVPAATPSVAMPVATVGDIFRHY